MHDTNQPFFYSFHIQWYSLKFTDLNHLYDFLYYLYVIHIKLCDLIIPINKWQQQKNNTLYRLNSKDIMWWYPSVTKYNTGGICYVIKNVIKSQNKFIFNLYFILRFSLYFLLISVYEWFVLKKKEEFAIWNAHLFTLRLCIHK